MNFDLLPYGQNFASLLFYFVSIIKTTTGVFDSFTHFYLVKIRVTKFLLFFLYKMFS